MTLTRGGKEKHKFAPNVSITRRAPIKEDADKDSSNNDNPIGDNNDSSFRMSEGSRRGSNDRMERNIRGGMSRGGRGGGGSLLASNSFNDTQVSGPFSQGPFFQESRFAGANKMTSGMDKSKITDLRPNIMSIKNTNSRSGGRSIINSDDEGEKMGWRNGNDDEFEDLIPLETLSLSEDPFRPLFLHSNQLIDAISLVTNQQEETSVKKENDKNHDSKENLSLLPMNFSQISILQIPEELLTKASFICMHESGKLSIQIENDKTGNDLIDLLPAIDTEDQGVSIFAIDTDYGQSFDLGSRHSHLIAEPTALQCIKYILTESDKVKINL